MFLSCFIVFICTRWINYRIDSKTSEFILDFEDIGGTYDAAIILWSKVYANGALGAIVRDRADMAIRLYKIWKTKKLLVSADNRTSNYNETKAIYQYLIDNQIPKIDIFLDFAGFDTFDSMYRAKNNFQISTLIIPNHVMYCPRSLYIARGLGMDAYCISMPHWDQAKSARWYYREIFSKPKAWFEVRFGLKAHFASPDLYPISETGNAEIFY